MSIGWSWETIAWVAGGWSVLSCALALVVARLIRAGQRPMPEDPELQRRSSGIVGRVDPNSPEWAAMAEQLEREAREREAAEREAADRAVRMGASADTAQIRELRRRTKHDRAAGE